MLPLAPAAPAALAALVALVARSSSLVVARVARPPSLEQEETNGGARMRKSYLDQAPLFTNY